MDGLLLVPQSFNIICFGGGAKALNVLQIIRNQSGLAVAKLVNPILKEYGSHTNYLICTTNVHVCMYLHCRCNHYL